jgi:hypothetical protein
VRTSENLSKLRIKAKHQRWEYMRDIGDALGKYTKGGD